MAADTQPTLKLKHVAAKARGVWKKELAGVFSGAFLFQAEGRIIYRYATELPQARERLVACLGEDGVVLWERRFSIDAADMLGVSADGAYLDGELARRLDLHTGDTIVERSYGCRVVGAFPGELGVVYTLEDGGTTVILDPKSFDEIWRWERPEQLLALHGEFVCCKGQSGSIEIRERVSGSLIHRFDLPWRWRGGHWHAAGLWVQFGDVERAAVDPATGMEAWSKTEPTIGHHSMTHAVGETAFCGDLGLSAYELRTGELLWRSPLGEPARWLSLSPHICEDEIWCGTRDGRVLVVDAHTGETLLAVDHGAPPLALAQATDGQIIVGSLRTIAGYERE